jgi:hypothetical protein
MDRRAQTPLARSAAGVGAGRCRLAGATGNRVGNGERSARAVEELHAARRDTERKLRSYRVQPAWRFTLLAKKRDFLHERTEKQLLADLHYLRRDLAYLDKTIAAWEEPVLGRSKPRYTTPRW